MENITKLTFFFVHANTLLKDDKFHLLTLWNGTSSSPKPIPRFSPRSMQLEECQIMQILLPQQGIPWIVISTY
jgi:hypothetical protein